MMTDEELDRARAIEAYRVVYGDVGEAGGKFTIMAGVAARLAREGWMPPDPLEDEIERLRHTLGIRWADEAIGMTYLRKALERGIEIGRDQ